jgi:hypothetical protein
MPAREGYHQREPGTVPRLASTHTLPRRACRMARTIARPSPQGNLDGLSFVLLSFENHT